MHVGGLNPGTRADPEGGLTVKVRFAVAPSAHHATPEGLAGFVDDLEDLRFDTVWLSDLPLRAAIDPVVGLAHAAARTSRIKLGANVVPLGREPVTLAKALAQVDRLSGGRLLLNFVVGLGEPAERAVLGVAGADRGRLLAEITPLFRTWWAGGTVDHRTDRYHLPAVASPGRPLQEPLEIWFGGRSPDALVRAGQFADGWLGASVTPAEAGGAVDAIQRAAADAGRAIDPEHFGISFAYAAEPIDPSAVLQAHHRRPDVDVADLLPVGPARLRSLVRRYADAGISKFVVRPVGRDATDRRHLHELAGVVHDLQT